MPEAGQAVMMTSPQSEAIKRMTAFYAAEGLPESGNSIRRHISRIGKDMPALDDMLSAGGVLRFAAHKTGEDIAQLEDRMAEVTQISYQQSRAQAEQPSKDAQQKLRKQWLNWVQSAKYRNAENRLRAKG